VALLLPLGALLGACGDGKGSEDAYFPTERGMRWVYRMTRTTMDGTRVRPYYIEHHGPVLLPGRAEPVEEQRTFDGNRYFLLRDPGQGWLRVGVQSTGDESPRISVEPRLLLPARREIGHSWRQTTQVRVLEKTGPPQETLFRVQASLPVVYRIEGTDETVTVPAGTFTGCLRIEGRGSISTHLGNYLGVGTVEMQSAEWYAPGVGLVRQSIVERTNRQALDHGELLLELTAVTRP
jgi:hypothetical protein